MKHLICNGCSFTRAGRLNIDVTDDNFLTEDNTSSYSSTNSNEFYYYPHQIQLLHPEIKVINLGNVTNDNQVIARNIIYKIEKLKKEGFSTKDISVIVQWSSFYRNSYFVSPSKIQENKKLKLPQHRKRWDDDYAHINDFAEGKNEVGENGYYFLSGNFGMEHVKNPMKDFAHLYLGHLHSYEERSLIFLETIMMLQLYLKSNGIKYKMFNIANNFSDTYVYNSNKGSGFPIFKPENSKNNEMYEIIKNKHIPNTWNDKMEYFNNPYLNYYWNIIDWNDFWFYEEDGLHKFGGVTEWAIRNFDINDPIRDLNYKNTLFLEQELKNGKEYTEDNLIDIYQQGMCPLGHVSARMYKIFVENIISKWELY
jgi:hypothetical protein